MADNKADDGDWFAPKRFGYGAGLPIAWQGWALIGGYAAVLISIMAFLAPQAPTVAAIVAIVLSIPVMLVTARHTRGGWKWRWGGDE